MTDHDCPGLCRRQVPNRLFACRGCWKRLPWALRCEISSTYGKDREAHNEAMLDAVDWYRANPITSSTR